MADKKKQAGSMWNTAQILAEKDREGRRIKRRTTPLSIRFVGPRAHQNQLRYMQTKEYADFLMRTGLGGTSVGRTGAQRIDERPATKEEMKKRREKTKKYLGKGKK